MRLYWKILIALVVILLAATIVLHSYVSVKGKQMLAGKLGDIFNRPVSVGKVGVCFPFTLIAKDIVIKDLCAVGSARAFGGALDVLSGNMSLTDLRLDHVALTVIRNPEKKGAQADAGAASAPATPSEAVETAPNTAAAPVETPNQRFRFAVPKKISIRHLTFTNGQITFIDRSFEGKEVTIVIKDIRVSVENLDLPITHPGVIFYKLNGRIPWQHQSEEGWVLLDGWIDLFKRDMRATLKVENIDGMYLQPYYEGWVNADKANIAKAKLNFTSQIVGLHNDVTANCHVELTQIEFKQRAEEEPKSRAERLASTVLDFFKAMNQGKIVLDFNFKTTMDNPQFGLGVVKDALQGKISEARKAHGFNAAEAAKLPVKIVGGTVEGATDLTKSIINSTITVGKELTNAVAASFRREPEPAAGPQNETAASENGTAGDEAVATTNQTVGQAVGPTNQTQ